MKVTPLSIPEVLLIEPQVFGDARGFFLESYRAPRYIEVGIEAPFVQDNVSLSRRGTLRGLHAQHPRGQGKLVQVLRGEVFDVAVDARVGSPTFGQWVGERLTGENHRQLYIPPGFLHGFCVTSADALFSYKCTEIYAPELELGVRYDDPDIGIEWPIQDPLLSARDEAHPLLRQVDPGRLPRYG